MRPSGIGDTVSGLIGYYVHHQGDGHRQRALSIASCAPERFVMLGTGLEQRTERVPSIGLDDDRAAIDDAVNPLSTDDCLHYAPLDHRGIQNRIAALASWIARFRPVLFVVDVSVEVAMLARLAGVRTVYVRLAGNRDDPPHRHAFQAAHGLLAPFHEDLDSVSTLEWVRKKTRYAPGLTRGRVQTRVDDARILVVSGAGGGFWHAEALRSAAAELPQYTWRVIGQAPQPGNNPVNLQFCGWVENADEQIAGAGIVIGHAGDGIVTSVIAANRPFVCLPQTRPYDEQWAKARRLAAVGAAVVLERSPRPAEWPELIRQVKALKSSDQARLHAVGGAQSACDWLLATADRST